MSPFSHMLNVHSSPHVAHILEAVFHSSGDLRRLVLMATVYVVVELFTFSNDMAAPGATSLTPNMALSGSQLFPVAAPKGASPAQPKEMRQCTG